jgi:WD40 repeat protein
MAEAGTPETPSAGAERDDVTGGPSTHGPQRDLESHTESADPTQRVDENEGRSFGRYLAHGTLARGGMGEVLSAWDPSLERALALKVMRKTARLDDTRGRNRFLDEAQIGAQLDHPGIVPVHDLGRDANDQPYFTMRLVEGRTLQQILVQLHAGDEDWNLVRVLGILLKVCEAMAFAHDRGIVHRDLKPANIMVGHYGEVYVMDWGLAHKISEDDPHDMRPVVPELLNLAGTAGESPVMTMQGDVIGTPAFMSPEQALGRMDDLGPRTDVYAAGAILYHLATGQMPHVSPNEQVSGAEVWRRVRKGPPQPIAEMAPSMPSELVAICEKAMSREVAGRYPDMAALAEDLRAFLEGRVVSAHRTGAVAEFLKWVQRNRTAAVTITASLAIVVIGSLTAASMLSQTNAELEDARDRALDGVRSTQAALERESAARLTAERAAEREELLRKQALLATENEKAAHHEADLATAREAEARQQAERAEQSALWQAYRANIAAASAHLELGDVGDAQVRLDACEDSLSGWERDVLELRQNTALKTWKADQPAGILTLALSPDGTLVASGGSVASLPVRDLASGKLVADAPMPGRDYVLDLAFTADGRRLIVATGESSFSLRDAITGVQLMRMTGHGGVVNAVAADPRGELFASASDDGTARLWDATTGEVLSVLTHSSAVIELAFKHDGSELATAGETGVVSIWNTRTGRRIQRLMGHTDVVKAVAFYPSGDRLLSGGNDGFLQVWDLSEGEALFALDAGSAVVDVAVSPDGTRLLGGCDDGSLRLWDAARGDSLAILRGHLGPVVSVAFTVDGSEIVSGSRDMTLRLWDEVVRAGPVRLPGHAGISTTVAFSAAGDLIASGSFDRRVLIREAASGDVVQILEGHNERIMSLTFALDGQRLASADYNGRVQLWDTTRGVLMTTLLEGAQRIAFVTASPDGSQLATASGGRGNSSFAGTRLLAPLAGEREIVLYDAATGAVQSTLPGQRYGTTVVGYSGDGRLLASGSQGGGIALWDTGTGELLVTLSEEPVLGLDPKLPPVSALALDEHGKTIVSAHLSRLYSLVVWDGETGEPRHFLGGQDNRVWSVVLTPDGSRMLSTGEDNTVRVWDTLTGEHLLTLTEPDLAGLWLTLRRDGRRLITTGRDGSLVVWDTDVEDARVLWAGSARREKARHVVAGLLDQYMLPELARGAVLGQNLSNDLRTTVLQQLAGAPEPSTRELNRTGWEVARIPGRPLDEYAWALALCEAAVARQPDHAGSSNTLGLCQYRLQRYDEALATLARADALNASGAGTYNRAHDQLVLAMCLAQLERGREADELWARATESMGGSTDPQLLELRAEAEQLLLAGP